MHDNVIISVGKYWFTDYELQFKTFKGRQVYGSAFVNWGRFYNGMQTIYKDQLAWQLNRHIKFSTQYTRHKINLPEGDFVVHEIGGRADFAVTPDLFSSLFGQWNKEDKERLLNFRINWIPTQGTNFYFVVNQGYNTQNLLFIKEYTTIQAKFFWRFVM